MKIIEGYIKLHRGLLNSWVLTCADADYLKLWIQILLNAAYKQTSKFYNGRIIQLMPGEVLFTRNHWAKLTHVSESKIRTMINAFEKDSMITTRSVSNACTIIMIVNWCAYQSEGVVRPFDDIPPTNQPTDCQSNNQSKALPVNDYIKFTTNELTNETTNGLTNDQPTIYKNSKNIRNKEYILEESKDSSARVSIPPYKEIMNLYHQICVSFPTIRELTPSRQKTIRTWWKSAITLDSIKELFEKAEKSDFLSNRNGNGFNCGFDWIIKPSNRLKILEGNYDNKQAQKAQRGDLQYADYTGIGLE